MPNAIRPKPALNTVPTPRFFRISDKVFFARNASHSLRIYDCLYSVNCLVRYFCRDLRLSLSNTETLFGNRRVLRGPRVRSVWRRGYDLSRGDVRSEPAAAGRDGRARGPATRRPRPTPRPPGLFQPTFAPKHWIYTRNHSKHLKDKVFSWLLVSPWRFFSSKSRIRE